MIEDVETMKLVVQQTLDELFLENLIPFKLSVQGVKSIGMEEYIIRFHESWLSSLDVSWPHDQTFKAIFRIGILDRVSRLGDCSQVRENCLTHPRAPLQEARVS